MPDDGIFLADSLDYDGNLADSLADDGIFLADSLAYDGIFTNDDCISLLYVSQSFNVILWDLAFSLWKHLNGISGKS